MSAWKGERGQLYFWCAFGFSKLRLAQLSGAFSSAATGAAGAQCGEGLLMSESTNKRRIGVITTSRADYSHLYWPLCELAAHPGVELGVFALGAHLAPEFGNTITEIERDGFPILARIECLLRSEEHTSELQSLR